MDCDSVKQLKLYSQLELGQRSQIGSISIVCMAVPTHEGKYHQGLKRSQFRLTPLGTLTHNEELARYHKALFIEYHEKPITFPDRTPIWV